jgi:hypothetical protein
VHDDQRRGVENQRALHHLTGINRRMIDCAALLYFVGNEVVLAIQEQDSELLDLLVGLYAIALEIWHLALLQESR